MIRPKEIGILLVLWLPGILAANTPGGLQWYYFSPRQMAMGFTGIALNNDPATASMNPGGIVFSRMSGVQVGSSLIRPATTYLETAPGVYLDTTLIPDLTPLLMNAVIHTEPDQPSNLSFGVAVNQPFGVSVTWPDLWKGKFISQEFSLNTYFVHLAMSVRLGDKVGLGVGGSYGGLTLLSRKAIRDTDGLNLDIGSVALSGSDLTWGIFTGIYVQVNEQLSLSACLRSPMRINIQQGLADFSVPASLEPAYPDQPFQTDFWLPPTLDLGLRFAPESRLAIYGAINLTAWQIMDSLLFTLEDPIPSLVQYPAFSHRQALSLRMGTEVSLTEFLSVRAGVYLENTPVPEEHLSPQIPDAASIGFTTGLGLRILGKLQMDLAYQFAFTGERSGILEVAKFGGTYESLEHGLSLGLSYLW